MRRWSSRPCSCSARWASSSPSTRSSAERGSRMATDVLPERQSLAGTGRRSAPLGQRILLGVVLLWFAALILVPTLALVRQALLGGLQPFFSALLSADARRAFALTLGITAVATLVNT